MINFISWVWFGMLVTMFIVNKLILSDCKDGYVRITNIMSPPVCVLGYLSK